MANTNSSLFYHLVFSTKNRRKLIRQDIESRVWQYIGGISRKNGFVAIQVGGIDDHIHVLVMAPPKMEPSKIAKLIKGGSSRWIHQEFPDLATFAWQDGFSVFTVSLSIVPKVDSYIRDQRRHHSKIAFEDEYMKLLILHEIDLVDTRFVFG